MTNEELRALDLAVAISISLPDAAMDSDLGCIVTGRNGLRMCPYQPTRDTEEAMRLAAERGMCLFYDNYNELARVVCDSSSAMPYENYTDHSGDKLAAMRVAIAKAVVAMAENANG